MKLSIVVVSHNTGEILQKCLSSIYENPPSVEFEVILVDNASSDGTIEFVRKKFQEVCVIENKKNRGFSAANNQGIAISKGNLILLLNSDAIILPGSLEAMIKFMNEHCRAGAIGPKIFNPDGTFQISFWSFPGLFGEFVRKILNIFLRFHFFRNFFDKIYNETKEVDWVTGACLLTRREVIEKVGVLDENFFMYFEDVDWCYRMKKVGWKIYYAPQAKIIHFSGKSMEKKKDEILDEYHRSQIYFYKKYRSKASVSFLKCLRFFTG